MKTQEELSRLIEECVKVFKTIDAATWREKSSPSIWSKKQILGHLIDSALTNLRRFVMTQYIEEEKIVYHQDEWVVFQQYQEADINDLIALWRQLNQQICRVIDHIPDEKRDRVCDTGKTDTNLQSLDFLIVDYVVHLKHHLKQIIGDFADRN